nr:MAG: polyprotein [Picornavirales sp.]
MTCSNKTPSLTGTPQIHSHEEEHISVSSLQDGNRLFKQMLEKSVRKLNKALFKGRITPQEYNASLELERLSSLKAINLALHEPASESLISLETSEIDWFETENQMYVNDVELLEKEFSCIMHNAHEWFVFNKLTFADPNMDWYTKTTTTFIDSHLANCGHLVPKTLCHGVKMELTKSQLKKVKNNIVRDFSINGEKCNRKETDFLHPASPREIVNNARCLPFEANDIDIVCCLFKDDCQEAVCNLPYSDNFIALAKRTVYFHVYQWIVNKTFKLIDPLSLTKKQFNKIINHKMNWLDTVILTKDIVPTLEAYEHPFLRRPDISEEMRKWFLQNHKRNMSVFSPFPNLNESLAQQSELENKTLTYGLPKVTKSIVNLTISTFSYELAHKVFESREDMSVIYAFILHRLYEQGIIKFPLNPTRLSPRMQNLLVICLVTDRIFKLVPSTRLPSEDDKPLLYVLGLTQDDGKDFSSDPIGIDLSKHHNLDCDFEFEKRNRLDYLTSEATVLRQLPQTIWNVLKNLMPSHSSSRLLISTISQAVLCLMHFVKTIATASYDKLDMFFHLSTLATSAWSVVEAILVVLNFKNVLGVAKDTLSEYLTEGLKRIAYHDLGIDTDNLIKLESSSKYVDFISRSVKFVVIVGVLCGLSVDHMKKFSLCGSVIKTTNEIIKFGEGTIDDISRFICTEEDVENEAFSARCDIMLGEIMRYINMPSIDFLAPEIPDEIDSLVKELYELDKKFSKRREFQSVLRNLSGLSMKLTDKLKETAGSRNVLRNIRYETIPVYVHGPPGHGKTHWVTHHLIPLLAQACGIEPSYQMTTCQKDFFPALQRVNFNVHDEFLGLTGDMMTGNINGICSKSKIGLDGAFVKDQECVWKFLILISNSPYNSGLDRTQYTIDYERAMWSRLYPVYLRTNVVDHERPLEDRNIERTDDNVVISYRQFPSITAPQFNEGFECEGLRTMLVREYHRRNDDFQTRRQQAMIPQGPVNDPILISFNGPTDTGKSYLSRQIAEQIGIVKNVKVNELKPGNLVYDGPGVYLLDDVVEGNEEEYGAFLDTVQSNSIVITTNNFDHIWTPWMKVALLMCLLSILLSPFDYRLLILLCIPILMTLSSYFHYGPRLITLSKIKLERTFRRIGAGHFTPCGKRSNHFFIEARPGYIYHHEGKSYQAHNMLGVILSKVYDKYSFASGFMPMTHSIRELIERDPSSIILKTKGQEVTSSDIISFVTTGKVDGVELNVSPSQVIALTKLYNNIVSTGQTPSSRTAMMQIVKVLQDGGHNVSVLFDDHEKAMAFHKGGYYEEIVNNLEITEQNGITYYGFAGKVFTIDEAKIILDGEGTSVDKFITMEWTEQLEFVKQASAELKVSHHYLVHEATKGIAEVKNSRSNVSWVFSVVASYPVLSGILACASVLGTFLLGATIIHKVFKKKTKDEVPKESALVSEAAISGDYNVPKRRMVVKRGNARDYDTIDYESIDTLDFSVPGEGSMDAFVKTVQTNACFVTQDGCTVYGMYLGKNLVVTVAHVIRNNSEINIMDDDSMNWKAEVVNIDPRQDLCILQITDKNFKPKKSISKYLLDETELGSISACYFLKLTSLKTGNTPFIYNTCATVKGGFDFTDIFRFSEHSTGLSKSFKARSLAIGWYSIKEIPTSEGDCGNVYFALTKSGMFKIFGLHNAKDHVNKRTRASSICKQDIEDMIIKKETTANSWNDSFFPVNINDVNWATDDYNLKKITDLDESAIFELPDSNINQFGRNPSLNKRTFSATELVKTPWSPEIVEHFPVRKVPAVSIASRLPEDIQKTKNFDYNGRRSQTASELNKIDPINNFDQDVLSDTINELSDYIKSTLGVGYRPLTNFEVLNGCMDPDDHLHTHLPQMCGDGSPGMLTLRFPVTRKDDFLRIERVSGQKKIFHFSDDKPHGRYLKDAYSTAEYYLTQGIPTIDLVETRLKDELLPINKPGKIRLFQNGGMVTYLLSRKYMGYFVAMSHKLRYQTPFTTGADFLREADVMHKHLIEVGNTIEAGDFSKFDKKLPSEIIKAGFKILENAAMTGVTKEDAILKRVFTALCTMHVNQFHVSEGVLWQPDGSWDSGVYITNFGDTLFNLVMYIYNAKKIYQQVHSCSISTSELLKVTRPMFNGDDKIVCLADVVKDTLTFDNMKEEYAKYGVILTTPMKTDSSEGGMTTTDEFEFSGRTFSLRNGKIYAALRTESIESLLHWTRDNSEIQYSSNIDTALDEASLWGYEYYNKMQNVIIKVVGKFGLPVKYVSHKNRLDTVFKANPLVIRANISVIDKKPPACWCGSVSNTWKGLIKHVSSSHCRKGDKFICPNEGCATIFIDEHKCTMTQIPCKLCGAVLANLPGIVSHMCHEHGFDGTYVAERLVQTIGKEFSFPLSVLPYENWLRSCQAIANKRNMNKQHKQKRSNALNISNGDRTMTMESHEISDKQMDLIPEQSAAPTDSTSGTSTGIATTTDAPTSGIYNTLPQVDILNGTPVPASDFGPPQEMIAYGGEMRTLPDTIWKVPMNLNLIKVDSAKPEGTLLAEYIYGIDIPTTHKFWMSMHERFVGDWIYNFSLTSNIAYGGSITIGWYPRKKSNYTIDDLNLYKPRTFVLNQSQAEISLTLGDARKDGFWRETGELEKAKDALPRIVILVNASLNNFNGTPGSLVTIRPTCKAAETFVALDPKLDSMVPLASSRTQFSPSQGTRISDIVSSKEVYFNVGSSSASTPEHDFSIPNWLEKVSLKELFRTKRAFIAIESNRSGNDITFRYRLVITQEKYPDQPPSVPFPFVQRANVNYASNIGFSKKQGGLISGPMLHSRKPDDDATDYGNFLYLPLGDILESYYLLDHEKLQARSDTNVIANIGGSPVNGKTYEMANEFIVARFFFSESLVAPCTMRVENISHDLSVPIFELDEDSAVVQFFGKAKEHVPTPSWPPEIFRFNPKSKENVHLSEKYDILMPELKPYTLGDTKYLRYGTVLLPNSISKLLTNEVSFNLNSLNIKVQGNGRVKGIMLPSFLKQISLSSIPILYTGDDPVSTVCLDSTTHVDYEIRQFIKDQARGQPIQAILRDEAGLEQARIQYNPIRGDVIFVQSNFTFVRSGNAINWSLSDITPVPNGDLLPTSGLFSFTNSFVQKSRTFNLKNASFCPKNITETQAGLAAAFGMSAAGGIINGIGSGLSSIGQMSHETNMQSNAYAQQLKMQQELFNLRYGNDARLNSELYKHEQAMSRLAQKNKASQQFEENRNLISSHNMELAGLRGGTTSAGMLQSRPRASGYSKIGEDTPSPRPTGFKDARVKVGLKRRLTRKPEPEVISDDTDFTEFSSDEENQQPLVDIDVPRRKRTTQDLPRVQAGANNPFNGDIATARARRVNTKLFN